MQRRRPPLLASPAAPPLLLLPLSPFFLLLHDSGLSLFWCGGGGAEGKKNPSSRVQGSQLGGFIGRPARVGRGQVKGRRGSSESGLGARGNIAALGARALAHAAVKKEARAAWVTSAGRRHGCFAVHRGAGGRRWCGGRGERTSPGKKRRRRRTGSPDQAGPPVSGTRRRRWRGGMLG